MKTSIIALALISLLAAAPTIIASDWQISIAGGTSQASSPSDNETNNRTEFSSAEVFHIVANHYQNTNRDGARLYTEYFIAANSLEAEVSGDENYTSNIDALHAQLGGVYEWGEAGFLRPYFVMTIGFSHYSPELSSEETYFSGSAGLGAKFFLTERLGLRLEARALGTLLNASSTIFCQSDDECSVGVDGTLWNQQHYTAGLSWSF